MQDLAQTPTQRVNWNRTKHLKFVRGPSTQLERRLYRALTRLGLRYLPGKRIGRYEVDAYLPKYQVAIEADGCLYHGCPICAYPPEPGVIVPTPAQVAKRDFALHRAGVSVLHLWGHELSTDEQARETLRRVLPSMGIPV